MDNSLSNKSKSLRRMNHRKLSLNRLLPSILIVFYLIGSSSGLPLQDDLNELLVSTVNKAAGKEIIPNDTKFEVSHRIIDILLS